LADGVGRFGISIENKNMDFRGVHTGDCLHSKR
jgi:hypothetical protein